MREQGRTGVPPGPGDAGERLAGLPCLAELREALAAAGVGRAWLVGGVLRDLFAGAARPRPDLDVALPGSGEAAARAVARHLGGSAFALDAAEGAWRVALGAGGTVDLVPLRAPTLADDLAGRDFTVNALAFDLLGRDGLLDPMGGLADLAVGRLRLCSPRALEDDPLRVLRAYRFAAGLGLVPEPGLPELLAAAAPGLARVSPERVRTELFLLLGLPRGAGGLRAMAEHGVLPALFPFTEVWRGFDQGAYHAYDLLEHSLRVAEAVEGLARDPGGLPRPDCLAEHLAQEWEAGLSRKALLVFAALVHDLAKPPTLTVEGERRRFLGHDVQGGHEVRRLLAGLRVGRRAARAARRLVASHLRLFQLADQDPPTRRARLRYLKDLGIEVPEALLLSLADELATGPEPPALPAVRRTAAEVLALFWERREAREVPPLLRGRDLLRELGLEPGPRVGEILRQVEAAERSGQIGTRPEALSLARRLAAGDPLEQPDG